MASAECRTTSVRQTSVLTSVNVMNLRYSSNYETSRYVKMLLVHEYVMRFHTNNRASYFIVWILLTLITSPSVHIASGRRHTIRLYGLLIIYIVKTYHYIICFVRP